jgi:hypothetical protein
MNYRLIVIGASLKDKSILQKYRILSKIEYEPGTVGESTIYKIEIPEYEVTIVSNFLKNTLKFPYYAHMYMEDPYRKMLIVIFPGQIFKNKNEAVMYGITHGIPERQMDITPTAITEETW